MANTFVNQIKSDVSSYGKSMGEIGLLRLIRMISRVLGLFLLIFTVVLCAIALFTFCAVAAVDALAVYMPLWAASLVICAVYLLLILIAFICKNPLFINPFIKLLSKQFSSEDELVLRIMEAEHEAELQRIRMECKVENATRELSFYANLLARLWSLIKGMKKK